MSVGEVLCEIETDKSTVGFEVQEDMYLAKILKPDGAADLKVGEVIAIGVSSKDKVAAFANYSDSGAAAPAAKPQETASQSAPAKAAQPAAITVKHSILQMPALSPTMDSVRSPIPGGARTPRCCTPHPYSPQALARRASSTLA